MILQKIKLSGFKSFVDSTTIPFPSCLVGVVGPNGCGKSNVIDAVRWVMGESAASRLRGGSPTDMIFSGSTQRQPAGQASVELIFDNSDANTGGNLDAYAEIAIRREVTREGQSTYFLNGTRCRKKDISDVFLGTGLGPRSYSIIQQGTVSQLIEAKPEEMRGFLEEAAGISKYKERRRETSNRIKHTRENLERLTDVRTELGQQLAHLQRQAAAAEKYKVLKQEQRLSVGELHALKWQDLQQKIAQCTQKLASQETDLEARIAKVRQVESEIEQIRSDHSESVDAFNTIQSKYYQVGGEVARIEQTIAHHKERKQQLSFDFNEAQSHWQQLNNTLSQDKAEMIQLETEIASLQPAYEAALEESESKQLNLEQAEVDLQNWRKEWDEFTELASASSKIAEVEQAKIRQLEERLLNIKNKTDRLNTELAEIDLTPLQEAAATVEAQIEEAQAISEQSAQASLETRQQMETKKQEIQSCAAQVDQIKQQLQKNQGRQASLEALQEAALGHKDKHTKAWLENNQLDKASRLAQEMQVEQGWEKAVEVVLGDYLQAVCVNNSLSTYINDLSTIDSGYLTLVTAQSAAASTAMSARENSLINKIQTSQPIASQLAHVFAVEDLAAAVAMQENLQPEESVITKDGIWLGKHWARVARDKDHQSGVIERERELNQLQELIQQQEEELVAAQDAMSQAEQLLQQYQSKLDALIEQNNQHERQVSRLEADLRVKHNHIEQSERRLRKLQTEINEQTQDQAGLTETLSVSRAAWHEALASMEQHDERRTQLNTRKDQTHQAVEFSRVEAAMSRKSAHEYEVKLQAAKTKFDSLNQTIERLTQQFENLSERKQQLEESLSSSAEPMEELTEKLEVLLADRLTAEKDLNQARAGMNELDSRLTQLDKDRHQAEDAVNTQRSGLEGGRLEIEGLRVRQQTVVEQLEEMGLAAEQVLENIEQGKTIGQLEEQLSQLERRIQRLGAINLAAIDEHKEKSERKDYLDQQNADLEEALATLESAINKIDKETREKFKETYNFVNTCFKELFPKIFGGGSASLELTGTDLLDTGVEVLARPPGKKNATIHLLSGGEKTMTAIALVFSIFQLNPSPFCMLDEVDAPLDDSNVMRFCELVKEMSAKVQFVVITHNKVTMEMMHQLMGVTMHEPGVSRIVSVDVSQATAMVEEA